MIRVFVVLGFLSFGLFSSAETVTYSEDIASILYNKCADCHRPGQIGPFSVLDYKSVRPWAKSIAKEVEQRRMPPWGADVTKTKFLNDRSLSDEEINQIVSWVSQGSKEGNKSKLPETPDFSGDWAIGTPDLIFEVEQGFTVPAYEVEIPYQDVIFTPQLEEDLYITAWELRPGNRKVVHHANVVYAQRKLDPVGLGAALVAGGDILGGFLPGSEPYFYPEGTALKIPKGSIMQLAAHYVGIDETVTESPRFGVRFANGRIDKLVRTVGTAEWEIEIEPHDPHWEMNSSVSLTHPLTILTSGAHMHYRGWAYTTTAVFPDGSRHLIADVPRYDFNWQMTYELAHPVEVPRDTKYEVRAVWNNSSSNPNNPVPEKKAVYGLWTENEMLQTWSHVVLTEEKLGLRIEDGRMIGRFPDAKDIAHPKILQSFPNFGRLQNKSSTN